MTQLVPVSAAPALPARVAAEPSAQPGGNDGEALKELLLAFRRRFWLFCAVTGIVAAMLAAVQLSAPRIYVATAAMVIDGRDRDVIDGEPAANVAVDEAAIDTEARVVSSRRVADLVIEARGLMQDPEFNSSIAPPPKGLAGLIAGARGLVQSLISPRKDAPPAASAAREGAIDITRERTIDAVLANLNVARVGETRVIEISFKSQSAQKSAEVANTFVDRYLFAQLDSQFETTRRANAWLSERLDELRGEVQRAEAAVEQFRAQAGLLSADGSTLTERQLAELQSQLVITRADLAEREARLQRVRSQLASGDLDAMTEVLASGTIQDLRSQEAEVVRRLADLRENYGAEWPERVRAEGELADLRQEIQLQTRRIVATIEQEAAVSRERERNLAASIGALRGQLAGANVSQVRLRELERTAEASRALYESFLARFKETGQDGRPSAPEAQLVSLAAPPQFHAEPRASTALAFSLVLGAIVGLIIVVALELLEVGYRTTAQIEADLGLNHLGLAPKVFRRAPPPLTWRDPKGMPAAIAAKAPVPRLLHQFGNYLHRAAAFAIRWVSTPTPSAPAYVVDKPMSSFAEAMRTLRASILLSQTPTPKVVLFTSAVSGEGKTSTLLSCARVSALGGHRVLAIDCDLRHKGLTKESGLTPEIGLLEAVEGECGLDAAIARDPRTPLHILPLSPAAAPSEDVFGTESMRTLIQQLRERYDLILIDSAPILLVAETRVLASACDASVLLARWRRTPRGLVRSAADALENARANVLGVVLSQVDTRAVHLYADGEMGAYYRAYQSYYTE